MATIGVHEWEDEWLVTYNLISEGGNEPVSSLYSDPDFYSFDLPDNRFEEKDDALEYAEKLMQTDLEEVFEDYGLRPDPRR